MPTLDAATLMMVIVVVDVFACVVWAILGGPLRIAPRAARRIAAYHALMALAWWPLWPPALEGTLALPLSLIASGLLTAGVRGLMRYRFGVRDVIAVVVLGLGAHALVHADVTQARILANACAALLALMAAFDILIGAGFRTAVTGLLTLPYLVVAVGGLWRSAGLLHWVPADLAPLGMAGLANNASLGVLRLVITLTIALGLVALVLQRLIARVRHLTRRDALTGLLNRRAMEDHLARMQALVERGHPHAVMVLDIDHFKRINDELGHAGGDAALQHLSQVLREALRDADRLGRLGGEEFAVLLPDTDLPGAALVAERLRKALQDQPLTWGDKVWPISASFGVAVMRRGDAHGRDALARADAAMYGAKARGRNRVLCSREDAAFA
ncbi:MAG: GGDEF domain-containing protein [Burkholderiaceae bacterium]